MHHERGAGTAKRDHEVPATRRLGRRDGPHVLRRKLARYVLDGESIEKIAGTLAREVRRPVKVMDWLDDTLYLAEPDGKAISEPLCLSPVARSLLRELRVADLARKPTRFCLSSGPVLASALIVAHETLGAMIIEDVPEGPATSLESHLSCATEFTSFLLLKQLAELQGRREATSMFVRSLFHDGLSGKEAAERALEFGIRITRPSVVLVVGCSTNHTSDLLLNSLRDELERPAGPGQRVVCGHLGDGRLIAILQREAAIETALEQISARLAAAVPESLIVASGSAYSGLEGVRRSKSEAQLAFNTARKMGFEGLVRFADFHVERLLSQIPEAGMMRDYVAAVVGPLENEPELLHTLELYLRLGGNKVATAAALPMHRSSLLYRLRKISQALGTNLEDPERRLELWLALKLRTWLAL